MKNNDNASPIDDFISYYKEHEDEPLGSPYWVIPHGTMSSWPP